MPKPNRTRAARLAAEKKLASGLAATMGKRDEIVLDGRRYPIQELVAILALRMALEADVSRARAALTGAVRKAREGLAKTDRLVTALRAALVLMCDVTTLAALGLAKRRPPRRLTAAERTRKAERTRATRAARKTLGKKQRRAVKGQLGAPGAGR